jgi:hypothetical protein
MDEDRFLRQLEELKDICVLEPVEIRKKVREIVPTYVVKK